MLPAIQPLVAEKTQLEAVFVVENNRDHLL